MARQELYRSAKLALMIHDLLKNVGENQGLEGWVQRKITRAADYIESVFDYLDYEMRYPSEMTEAETMQVTPQNPNQPKTGGAKKPPGLTQTPGMVKMAKIDANGNVQGVPVMVPAAQVKSKQQSGFHVIGESASAGASSAGGIAAVATPMGGMISRSGVGSLFGGTYKQKKSKKKVAEYQLNELDLYAPVTTFIKMRDGSYIQADWRRHQYTKGLADRASFISFKPVNPSVVKQLGLDNINALRKSGRSTGEITQGADYQQGGPMGDRKFDVVDFSDRSIDDIPDNLKIALVKWIQNKGVSEDVEDKKTGPKFTGYWKGKDKGKPGNKMVGSD
jgi:hypothetical protein